MATIPLLILASFLIFWTVNEIGDPRDKLAACATCDQSAYDRLVDLYELDKPVVIRWGSWLGNIAFHGDMGTALSQGEDPVKPIVITRTKNTAMIAIPAFLTIVILAVALSVYSAIRQYSLSDYTITALSFAGIALPTFVLGLFLQVLWGIWIQDWLGIKPFYVTGKHTASFGDLVSSIVLPVITLSAVFIGAESRFGRSAMLEIINADYIRTARAKGLPERRVIFKHALRNALIPFITIWALDFAALLGGSVITESIFSWPGLGPIFLTAITGQDIHLIMGIVLVVSMMAIGFNLIADLLYGVFDPRIRYD